MKKNDTDTIQVRFPKAMRMDMDFQIASGLWPNRSVFIRAAVAKELSSVNVVQAPFSELVKLLKRFDQDYVEIWRDKEKAMAMVKRVDDLKVRLAAFPDLLQQARSLEKKSKLLSIARVDIGQMPPVTGASMYNELQTGETDGFFEALDQARKASAAADRDTSWIDKIEKEYS